jgi:hypothetical protein
METGSLIQRIKQVGLVQSDTSQDWNVMVERFPYFTIGRFLRSFQKNWGKPDYQANDLGPYKQSPFLFAEHIKMVREGKPVEMPTSEVPVSAAPTVELTQQPIPIETLEEDLPAHEFLAEEVEMPLVSINTEDIITDQSNQADDSYDVTEQVDCEEILDAIQVLVLEEEKMQDNPRVPEMEIENTNLTEEVDDKQLMVVMSFMDWLEHFKTKTKFEQEEERERKALKTAWQKEKLAAIVEEEGEEIPETIFKQAMESISFESSLISESLASLLGKQGKTDKAIEMYKKLSLRNPEKSHYFADRIRELNSNNT